MALRLLPSVLVILPIKAFTRLCCSFRGLFVQESLLLVALSEVTPPVSQSVQQNPGLLRATMWPICRELVGGEGRTDVTGQVQCEKFQIPT